jgi:hypothetical protein
MTACESVDCHGGKVGRRGKSAPVYHLSEEVNFQPTKTHLNNFFIFPLSFPIKKMLEHFFKNVRTFFKENVESKFFHKKLNQHFLKKLHQHLYRQKMLNPTFFFKRFHQHFCDNVGQHFLKCSNIVVQHFFVFLPQHDLHLRAAGSAPAGWRGWPSSRAGHQRAAKARGGAVRSPAEARRGLRAWRSGGASRERAPSRQRPRRWSSPDTGESRGGVPVRAGGRRRPTGGAAAARSS